MDREQIRAKVRQASGTYADALGHSKHANSRAWLAWSALHETVQALEKAQEHMRRTDKRLEEGCEHNQAAAEGWSKAFEQLIGAGAAESSHKDVITALANANHEGQKAAERQATFVSNHEKIAPFLASLGEMLAAMKGGMSSEIHYLYESTDEFVDDSGPGMAGRRALRDWEEGI